MEGEVKRKGGGRGELQNVWGHAVVGLVLIASVICCQTYIIIGCPAPPPLSLPPALPLSLPASLPHPCLPPSPCLFLRGKESKTYLSDSCVFVGLAFLKTEEELGVLLFFFFLS